MNKLRRAIKLYGLAMQNLKQARTTMQRIAAKRRLQYAFDLLVSAVASSYCWTQEEHQAFDDFCNEMAM